MNAGYWVALGLVVLMLIPSLVYLLLYLGTREPLARERAAMFWRYAWLVVLGTANVAIFKRVFDAVLALF